MKKIHLTTLGCDKNTVDSEQMLSILSKMGEIVSEPADADIILINTCCFINPAKEESIDYILAYSEFKKMGSCEKLIVTGCMAERYGEELLKEMPEVDAFLGPGRINSIGKLIDSVYNGTNENKLVLGNIDTPYVESLARWFDEPKATAYLKISEGCNKHCTYCAIPAIRGKHRSRQPDVIIEEAKELVSRGVKEIILIAQDLTQYGEDLEDGWHFSRLLKMIAEESGANWVRLLYLYPEGITNELIEVVANHQNICNYFDIPFQHTENRILQKMGRPTTKETLFERVNYIRKCIPDAIIRTTLIAGFPGESIQDFNDMCESLELLKLDRVGIFGYSQEEGTKAASMVDQIDEVEIERRRAQLYELQTPICANSIATYVGQVVDVLIESQEDGVYTGRMYSDAPEIDCIVLVQAKNKGLKLGNFYKIKIVQTLDYELTGEVFYEFT